MKNQGIATLAVLLIVIGVLVVGAGVWYLTRGPAPAVTEESVVDEELMGETDPTAGWSTYRNEEFRFEVRYPDYFFVDESTLVGLKASGVRPERFELLIHRRSLDGFEYANQAGAFSFVYNKAVSAWTSPQGAPREFAPAKGSTINGAKVFTVVTGAPTQQQIAYIESPREDYVVEVQLLRNLSYVDCLEPCPEDEPLSSDNTFNQILSTFRFISVESEWR